MTQIYLICIIVIFGPILALPVHEEEEAHHCLEEAHIPNEDIRHEDAIYSLGLAGFIILLILILLF